MATAALSKLLALGASLVVSLLAIWWLTRHERQRTPHALVAGYPPSAFPHRERLEGPLGGLCESQARALELYRRVPSSEPIRVTLLVFLEELRALMDGAYELAGLGPAAQSRLEQLERNTRAAVSEMTESAQRCLGRLDGHGPAGDLEVRVEVLRALARDVGDP